MSSQLRTRAMEKSYSQARLNALRMQLDPHFLFNALNTISSHVERDPKLTRLMIEHLGDLLRMSLESKDRQEVPLAEELAFLDHYLAIQKIRFGRRLKVEIDVAPEVRYASVPSLFLQPLVENAIRHGISHRASGGTVQVTAEPVGGKLAIRVADDGAGLPPGWTLENSNGPGLVGDARAHRRPVSERRRQLCHQGHAKRAARWWKSFCPCASWEKKPMKPALENIKVLVVDDEAPARQRLLDLLRRDPQIGTILEACNGQDAVELIEDHHPDLVFLDVQMPELDGLGVIDAIGAAEMPLTVFITAYDQHAIRAFESNALDYLLKPFSDERFEGALARAKARLEERSLLEFGQRVMKMVSAAPQNADKRWDRLVVKSGGSTRFIRVVDVDWIEAAGVYVNLHVAGKEFLYRTALNDLADRLDPRRFVRVHRSAIVNIESIVQLEPISHGEFDVVLRNGSRARVSRTYRAQLEKRLGQPL